MEHLSQSLQELRKRWCRIYLTLATECKLFVRFVTAIGANIAGRENFVITMRADFTHQSISLFLELPVSWELHFLYFFSISLILSRATLEHYQD